MSLQAPLDRLTLDARHLLFILSLGGLLLFGNLMSSAQAGPTEGLPQVSQKELEFAADPGEADELIDSWCDEGVQRLRKAIGWDFGFLLAYAPLLSLTCSFAANGPFRQSRRTRALGILLSWGSLVAAVADVGANAAMLTMLEQAKVSSSMLWTAKAFAGVEFALLGAALTYLLAAGLLSLLGHSRAPEA